MKPRRRHFASVLLIALSLTGVAYSAGAQQTRAFVAATDFATGSLADVTFGPPRVATPNVASISSDAVVRWYGGLVYVVNRFNFDNIQVLDPANGFSVERQFSVGNGANPHDIEFASPTKAYVTRYELADLLIVNPSTGARIDSISLAPFADADGIPEMDHLAFRNGRLFVTLQRLDRNNFFTPAGGSQVVVIDGSTDTFVDVDPGTPGTQGLLLPAQNPVTELVVDPFRQLVVGCVGSFGLLDGLIASIDPIALTVATEITEAALGGDIGDVATLNATDGFAVISDASFNTALKSYRRDLGTAQTMITSNGFFLADIEINDRGELWVCDADFTHPGIRIFNAQSHSELTPSPISTGLPPFDIAFDVALSLVAVEGPDSPLPNALSTLRALPNPSRGAVRLHLALGATTLPNSGDISVEIVDVSGRVCWSKTLPLSQAGKYALTWDGSLRGGKRAPSGIYFVRAQTAVGITTGRIVRLN